MRFANNSREVNQQECVMHNIIAFRNHWFFELLVGIVLVGLAGTSSAVTIYANSPSCLDVNSAVLAAREGDTVVIPAGNADWTEGITISKGITLQGTGRDSTTISHNGTLTLINVKLGVDSPVRITGISFSFSSNNPGGRAITVLGKADGSFALTKLRIDNNRFIKGTRALQVNGWVEGVIDSNIFVNCNIAVGVTGDNNYSWNRPIAAGTGNALFIENNTFLIDNNADREPNEQVYHQEGARTVTRYNTFDGTSYTAGSSHFYDSHGNQNYYTGTKADFRGQPILELYENTFKAYYTYNMIHFRGGSAVAFNNNLATMNGLVAKKFRLTEEEAWSTAFFSPLKRTWSAEDQVTNSFFWGNTYNGSAIIDAYVTSDNNDTIIIQKGRDYFMHAPEPSGGKSIYSERQGGMLTFSGSGENAYYPYIPYLYPHPLRGIRTILPPSLRLSPSQ